MGLVLDDGGGIFFFLSSAPTLFPLFPMVSICVLVDRKSRIRGLFREGEAPSKELACGQAKMLNFVPTVSHARIYLRPLAAAFVAKASSDAEEAPTDGLALPLL